MMLSHPQKLMFSAAAVTKQDLYDYYAKIAEHIFPYLKGRPLSLVRCTKGQGQDCFYQKHWQPSFPPHVQAVEVQQKSGLASDIMITESQGVLELAQLDVLELHAWLSHANHLNQPDQLVFDLDPGPKVAFKAVIAAALLIQETLTLKSYPKLTGGKGIHVVVPLQKQSSFQTTKQYAKNIAVQLAEKFPERFTSDMRQEYREGKIFIDYLRNDYGATAVLPFSPRAKAHAPIAVPVDWKNLPHIVASNQYTLTSIKQYFEDFPDNPWADFSSISQTLSLGSTHE